MKRPVFALFRAWALVGMVAWPSAAAAQEDQASVATMQVLADELTRSTERVDEVEMNLARALPTDRAVFEFQRRRRWRDHHEALLRLVREIEGADAATVEGQVLTDAGTALQRELGTIAVWLDEVSAQMSVMRAGAAGLPPESQVGVEVDLTLLSADIDELMRTFTDDYELGPLLGVDVADAEARHDAAIVGRTELLGAALEQALQETAEYRARLAKPGIDTLAVGLRIAALEERVAGTTTSLQSMVDLMVRRGQEVSAYRELIVTATGQLGTEVLDTRVLGGLLARWSTAAFDWFMDNVGVMVLRLVMLVLIFIAARRLSRIVEAMARRLLTGLDLSSLIKNLVVAGSGKAVWLISALIVLSLLGIDLGPMLAGLGIAGFVLGFALQDTLSNFAAGLMIMVYRPFDVGDFVTAGGVTGEVKDLTLVSTVIRTLDNKRIIVPNGKVWGDVINNATAEKIRRVDLVFGISYEDDVDQARAVLEDIVSCEERVLVDPAPMVRVDNLGDSSVDLICRPWCKTGDYWDLHWDLTRAVKKRFDSEGISFPFPQRDIHVYHETAVPPLDAFHGPQE
jgi:small conductance mechanosensitive channel